jgi:acyl dehydratase
VTRVFETLDELRGAVGEVLGTSAWIELDQDRIDQFGAAVGDGVLALPYLAVSLSNLFLPEIVEVRGASLGVNYGTGAIRFPTPLRAGRLRGHATLVRVDEVAGGIQTTMAITIEADGEPEPVCTIESLSRYLGA